MLRKYYSLAVASLLCGALQAQDIYKVETFSGSDLNGTARFVGMGGAMNALGADLSTMGSNPAGIGMFRKSDASLSASCISQPNARLAMDINKVRGSFDQAGFVYAMKMPGEGKLKFVNFGFNYQKRRNLKNYAEVLGGQTNGWSQTDVFRQLSNGFDLNNDRDRDNMLPIVNAAYDAQLSNLQGVDLNGETYRFNGADAYNYQRVTWGGIQQYDFNISLNWKDQVYAGLTFGVYNVNMHSSLYYDEDLLFQHPTNGSVIVNGEGNLPYYYSYQDEAINGTGFDFKLGVIARPIEDSSFRIGFSVSTPIFFDLTQESSIYFNSPFALPREGDANYRPYAYSSNPDEYTESDFYTGGFDYRIRTPWKVNLSLGGTVGNFLALDGEYEATFYKSASVGYPDFDYYGFADGSTSNDRWVNKDIDNYMQTSHTLRLGAEAKFADIMYLRAGYNYVSSPFKKSAFLDLFTPSPNYYARTNTDYLNLGDTQRVTLGLGCRSKHFYGDIAYQYQRQRGDLYAFNYFEGNTVQDNYLPAQKVNLDRHQVLFTVGYKF